VEQCFPLRCATAQCHKSRSVISFSRICNIPNLRLRTYGTVLFAFGTFYWFCVCVVAQFVRMRFVRNQLRNHADTTKQTFAQCRLEQELFGGGAVWRRSCSEEELFGAGAARRSEDQRQARGSQAPVDAKH